MVAKLLIVLSAPVFAAWAYQVWWSEGELALPGGPNHLALPSVVWSTCLFAIALGILLEGLCRLKGR